MTLGGQDFKLCDAHAPQLLLFNLQLACLNSFPIRFQCNYVLEEEKAGLFHSLLQNTRIETKNKQKINLKTVLPKVFGNQVLGLVSAPTIN